MLLFLFNLISIFSSSFLLLLLCFFCTKDIGIYECVAENYLGSVGHRARINQMGPPFVKTIGNQTAVLGQPFTINCTYGGYPLEEVYFIKGLADSSRGGAPSNKPLSGSRTTHNNKRMPFDERHLVPMLGSITINPVEKSDQDYYHCVVVTSNGERAEHKFYLNVVGRFFKKSISEIFQRLHFLCLYSSWPSYQSNCFF